MDQLVNRNGTIPTVKTVTRIREELWKAYFDSFTSAETASSPSSKEDLCEVNDGEAVCLASSSSEDEEAKQE
jgi:hypothetical protein